MPAMKNHAERGHSCQTFLSAARWNGGERAKGSDHGASGRGCGQECPRAGGDCGSIAADFRSRPPPSSSWSKPSPSRTRTSWAATLIFEANFFQEIAETRVGVEWIKIRIYFDVINFRVAFLVSFEQPFKRFLVLAQARIHQSNR